MSSEHIFSEIYRRRRWGKNVPASGEGTSPLAVRPYLEFLDTFLCSNPKIDSILDIGHGDWEMWPNGFFDNHRYFGIDVVSELSKELNLIHGNETTNFNSGDFLKMPLPSCDILLIKDVLIHLSDLDILKALKIFANFNIIVATNDISSSGFRVYFSCLVRTLKKRKWRNLLQTHFMPRSLIKKELESDITTGDYHWVNLRDPKWNIEKFGLKIIQHHRYEVSQITLGRSVIKEILVLSR
jgi:hypothetical protein